ncbi:hypothetical protein ACS0PU_001415 [Formica fusca]
MEFSVHLSSSTNVSDTYTTYNSANKKDNTSACGCNGNISTTHYRSVHSILPFFVAIRSLTHSALSFQSPTRQMNPLETRTRTQRRIVNNFAHGPRVLRSSELDAHKRELL